MSQPGKIWDGTGPAPLRPWWCVACGESADEENRREGVCRWCDDKERSFRERMDRRKGRAA